jgi:hypothetical protein
MADTVPTTSVWGCILALAGVALSAPAWAHEVLLSVPVTIEQLDRKNRTMVVKTADGDRIPMEVPPDVQEFDKVNKGDKVEIDYYRAVAVRVLPGAAGSESAQAQETGTGADKRVTSTSRVVSANDRTMRVKDPSGKTQTVSAQDPSVQKQLQGVKPGDLVELTYTEAILAGLHPHKG